MEHLCRQRLFSKATARCNIKPKNVNMILSLNKNILCFGIVHWFIEIFWFVWGREAISYDMVSVYYVNTIESPLPGWYYPMPTSNSSKIYMLADLDNFSRHWILPHAPCPMPHAQWPMRNAQCPKPIMNLAVCLCGHYHRGMSLPSLVPRPEKGRRKGPGFHCLRMRLIIRNRNTYS